MVTGTRITQIIIGVSYMLERLLWGKIWYTWWLEQWEERSSMIKNREIIRE